MRRAIRLALSLSIGPLSLASSQSDQPVWTLNTDRYISFYQLTPEGILVVSTEGGLLGVDTATGKAVWTRGDVSNIVSPGANAGPATSIGTAPPSAPPRAWLDVLSATPYGVLTIDSAGERARLELIDLRTGERRWDSRGLPVHDVRGYFDVPGRDLLMVYGTAGEPGSPQRLWLGVDLETGALRWQSDSLLPEPPIEFEPDGTGLDASRGALRGHQGPVLDSDSTAVLFVSEWGPVKINLRTGSRVWASALRAGRPPALVQDYPRILEADGVLYAPAGKSLEAFSAADGRPLWPAPRKFSGQVAQLELTSAGLLVRGGRVWAPPGNPRGGKPFLEVLDPATGTARWAQRGKQFEVTTPFALDGDRLYVATRNRLYRIALRDGTASELAEVKFRGGEEPVGLEYRDGKVLLLANHNVALFDTAGVAGYQAYFERPAASTFQHVTRAALLVASVYSLASGQGYGYYYMPPLVYPAAVGERPPSSAYVYVVAAHADTAGIAGPGLLKVRKDTGKPERWVVLADKSPDYRLDERGGLLLVKRDDRQIDCYRF